MSFLAKAAKYAHMIGVIHGTLYVMIESLTHWFIETRIRMNKVSAHLVTKSANNDLIYNQYKGLTGDFMINFNGIFSHPFLDACLGSKQRKQHRKKTTTYPLVN